MFKAIGRAVQGVGDVNRFFWSSIVFVLLATAAIQYEEVIAPGMSKLSDGWSSMTTGLKRHSGFDA